MNLLPKGLWPVMLTPFNDRNEVDIAALEQLTEFYIAAGSSGLFANCLSSEMFQLSDDERLLVTKKVVEVANGRVPVISTGSFGSKTDTSVSFIKKMAETGVAAVIISTSQVCDELASEGEFKNQIEKLINQTGDIPLGLYECPVPYKRLVSPELMMWMADSNRFLFHKDTSCNLEVIKKKIKAVEGSSLGFYNAHVPTGSDAVLSGARGLAPISANLYPELLNHQLKTLETVVKPNERLDLVLDLMDTIIHHNYPFTAKVFLSMRGLSLKTHCRIPRLPMQVADYKKLDTIMKVFRQESKNLGIEVVKF